MAGADGERPRLRLLKWRKVHRGHVVGFADVELPIGLTVADIMVIAKGDGVWVNMPSRVKVRTVNGVHELQRGADGKPVYEAVMGWRSRALGEAFSERVVQLLRDNHPADIPAVRETG